MKDKYIPCLKNLSEYMSRIEKVDYTLLTTNHTSASFFSAFPGFKTEECTTSITQWNEECEKLKQREKQTEI